MIRNILPQSIIDQLLALRDRASRYDEGYLLCLATVTGVLMGIAAAGFRLLVTASHRFFQRPHGELLGWRNLNEHPLEVALQGLLPAIGGLLVGLLIYRLLHLRGGHGVPSVMKAVATAQLTLHPSMAIKSLTAPITIASGGSTGAEGPMVEIGAVVGSLVGGWGKCRKDHLGALIGCGAAAGIAAIFGAPIGGVIFSLELIMRDFTVRRFAPVVVAAVTASVTASALLPAHGAFAPLQAITLATIEPTGFVVLEFALLGCVCAAVGALLVTALYGMHDAFSTLRIPMWAKPAVGGLVVGIIGLFAPSILGEGYESVSELLLRQSARPHAPVLLIATLCGLVVLKVIATSLTLGSGGTGGTFAPSMVAGAFTGGAVGLLFNQLAPSFSPDYRIFTMVGMAGVVSSALGTPLAAMFILYEVAGGHYQLVFPLMITVAISSLVSARMRKGSVYTLSLLRDGFDVEEAGRGRNPLASLPIESVMSTDYVTLRPQDNLTRILEQLASSEDDCFIVADERQKLLGIISTTDLRSVLNLGELGGAALIAQDIADPNPPHLSRDAFADRAMDIFGSTDVDGIPIVDSDGSRRVVGLVTRAAVLRSYRQAAAATA